VANLAALPQPEMPETGPVTGADDVADEAVDEVIDDAVDDVVDGLSAFLPPPHATSVEKSNAVKTCFIFFSSIDYYLSLVQTTKILQTQFALVALCNIIFRN